MKGVRTSGVSKRRRKTASGRKRLTEAEMDRQDLIAARKAMKEPGPNIPWEQVKAELGL